MKFRNQAQKCLTVYDFEARIKISLCLTFSRYQSTCMGKIYLQGGYEVWISSVISIGL